MPARAASNSRASALMSDARPSVFVCAPRCAAWRPACPPAAPARERHRQGCERAIACRKLAPRAALAGRMRQSSVALGVHCRARALHSQASPCASRDAAELAPCARTQRAEAGAARRLVEAHVRGRVHLVLGSTRGRVVQPLVAARLHAALLAQRLLAQAVQRVLCVLRRNRLLAVRVVRSLLLQPARAGGGDVVGQRRHHRRRVRVHAVRRVSRLDTAMEGPTCTRTPSVRVCALARCAAAAMRP